MTEDILDALSALEPPDELTTDQEILRQYLDDQIAFSREALVAIEAQDAEMLFEISERAFATYCEARRSLSPEILPVVHGHFESGVGCAV